MQTGFCCVCSVVGRGIVGMMRRVHGVQPVPGRTAARALFTILLYSPTSQLPNFSSSLCWPSCYACSPRYSHIMTPCPVAGLGLHYTVSCNGEMDSGFQESRVIYHSARHCLWPATRAQAKVFSLGLKITIISRTCCPIFVNQLGYSSLSVIMNPCWEFSGGKLRWVGELWQKTSIRGSVGWWAGRPQSDISQSVCCNSPEHHIWLLLN